MMESVRNNPPKKLGGLSVIAFRDYQKDKKINFVDNTQTTTGLPKSNVLYFELENNCWCCIRPSGTEPKIKFYFGVKSDSAKNAEESLERVKKDLLSLTD
jgi:phosphoglucomutase